MEKSLLQHLCTAFSPSVAYFSISQPCISIHCSMKCDRKEESTEWIIGRDCYTCYFLFCFVEGIERKEKNQGKNAGNTQETVGRQCF